MTSPFRDHARIDLGSIWDSQLARFESSLDLLDSTANVWQRIEGLCASPVFLRIHEELGFPSHLSNSEAERVPGTLKRIKISGNLYHPNDPWGWQVLETVHKMLREALGSGDKRTWNRLKDPFYLQVLGIRATQLDNICGLFYRTSIHDLVNAVRKSASIRDRQQALLMLVSLDISYLSEPFAKALIGRAGLANELAFTHALVRAVLHNSDRFAVSGSRLKLVTDPPKERKTSSLDYLRQRRALEVVLSICQGRWTSGEIAQCFRRYKGETGARIARAWTPELQTLTDAGEVRRALKRHGLTALKGEPGRPRRNSR